MTESVKTLENKILPNNKKRERKRLFYDLVFVFGFLTCLPVGAFPGLSTVFSLLLFACIAVSVFDENFYLYSALFMYMRYVMLIGDTPVYRLYSYLIVIKFIFELPKVKFRVVYLPALFVFCLHSIFALGRMTTMRMGLNALVDCVLIYAVLLRVLENKDLLRKFMFAFVLGGITSGVYGWTNVEMSIDINVRGAGDTTVHRNFGSLGDPNFAGMYYSACMYLSLLLKNIPKYLKPVLCVAFFVMIIQTASISGLLILCLLGVVAIILKYRVKAFFILLIAFVAIVLILGFLLAIPQFREITEVQGLLIRFEEKLYYINAGRFDLLTTDRIPLWQEAINSFINKDLLGQLIGGSVITIMYLDRTDVSRGVHQSILQGLLDFGLIGTLLIYLPFLATLAYRTIMHFSKKANYEDEDIGIIRIMMPLTFFIFGMSVDFFVDWAYLFFYFI